MISELEGFGGKMNLWLDNSWFNKILLHLSFRGTVFCII